MKVNELMIGDWVLVNGIPMQIQAIDDVDGEIMAGDELYCLIEDRVHSEDKIEPIPLTSEILEKNGFKKEVDKNNFESYLYYNFAGDGFIRVILWDGGDGDWSIKIGNYDKFDDNEIIYKNDFVFLKLHQLQHALKLCGIDKEIVI